MADDPRLQYFSQVSSELALDILNKIEDKQLQLSNYRLTLEVCNGFLQACKEEALFERVLIDNCGVDDHMMAVLLEACLQVKVKSLVLKRCKIGRRSVEVLRLLSTVRKPHHLEDLWIQNCALPHEWADVVGAM
jgi:hypothetical protein